MKKIFSFLLLIGCSIMAHSKDISDKAPIADCISGNIYIVLGQTATFTSVPVAQCSSCYDWDINNDTTSSDNSIVGNLQIVGSDMGQTVSIKGIALGEGSLQLTYFDDKGCHQCNLIIYVIKPTPPPPPLPRITCFGFDPATPSVNDPVLGILNMGFVNNLSSPLPYVAGITYTWYIKFKNGDLQTYYVQNPTFYVNCTNDSFSNPVKSFGLIVSNGVTSNRYYCKSQLPLNQYDIPGFTVETQTCFFHEECQSETQSLKNVSQSTFEKIKVYPNPTSSVVKFEGAGLKNYTVSIFDSNGNEVVKNAEIQNEINLEKLDKGIYIYKILEINRLIQEGKVIKN
ncbi:MAG: T9SS type A sorting domain-containing protein [Flavobacterium sp.]